MQINLSVVLCLWDPTGVGKTETAKQLAPHLGVQPARFDMSEYPRETHSSQKLIEPGLCRTRRY